jgi:hypothetical protein
MRPSKNLKEGFFPAKSSALHRWGYCPSTRTLEVVFAGKPTDPMLRRYRYYDVCFSSYCHFSTDPSVGKAFNEWIKGIYRKRRQSDIINPDFLKDITI